MLIFDKADAFLQKHESVQYGLEAEFVNEMQKQMKTADHPFVCTTNLADKLDMALVGQFLFKVKYDFLKGSQVAMAFEKFFGKKPTVSLSGLTKLSPADFSLVKKQADVLGVLDDHAELYAMLEREQHTKTGAAMPTVGFQR